jgi:hypothetical protein
MPPHALARLRRASLLLALALAACKTDTITGPSTLFTRNPCLGSDTITLQEAQATRVDCSNGGTTVTLTGGGASYLIVPQFATDQATNQFVQYTMASGTLSAAIASARRMRPTAGPAFSAPFAADGALPPSRPNRAQLAADRLLRSRARQRAASGAFSASVRGPLPAQSVQLAPPPVGSVRSFEVFASFATSSFKPVGARLAFVGSNILLYVDTLSPSPGGFDSTALANYGQLFDQTLFPIDTTAFGAPSDIDPNGRYIVLPSPVVNADTPQATCAAGGGFIAGFFNEEDFNGPTDLNSNQGEIFYSIVPDSLGTVSCAHTVDDLGLIVPATFLHELQHLISFSQHVIIDNGTPGASWLDEGLSIVAEELGSRYYEAKCPPPSCRLHPEQLFPDSSQGFIQSFLYDSYKYALLPDTASVTLHDDSEFGFSWRGGVWLLLRWLGDQVGSGVYRLLEHGSSDGVTAIEQASGQSFPTLFANFGLALYTDSLLGLKRTTAPAVNRFSSRNVKQLWARLFVTARGPTSDIPLAEPVQLFSFSQDTVEIMDPGTMTFFRLEVPAGAVTIRFATPAGAGFPAALKPQMAIFRLPAGQ